MRRFFHLLVFTLAIVLGAPALWADTPGAELSQKAVEGVGVDEKLGDKLPLDLAFTDESGKPVKLRDYFQDDVPVLITLNYSDCPMLCSLELDGLVKGLSKLEWSAGKQFRMITVSLNPKETPAVASKTKKRYTTEYGRPSAQEGWHFLTGSDENIHALARAIGFRYKFDAKKNQYYHAAAITIATPDGRIGRYLYGIKFVPETLRLGLVESSEGKIGTTIDHLILFCCAYDPKEGSYALVANRVMTLGGILTLIVLGGALGFFWLREMRKRRHVEA
ncbi:MAG: SCO family protein [Myxococcales bacterium]|nr:SCO family protein [Myxococcales bacterium]MCB9580765.1 SCO family protein [Polyangiaceae bacterium]